MSAPLFTKTIINANATFGLALPYPSRNTGLFILNTSGTFGGASLAVQGSYDGGTTWVTLATVTAAASTPINWPWAPLQIVATAGISQSIVAILFEATGIL